MALPSVRWPLPKASVEYTWVQLGKVLRSALKSRGSPAQQMCGMVWGWWWWVGGLSERKLTEREKRDGTPLNYLQWPETRGASVSSACAALAEAPRSGSLQPAGPRTLACVLLPCVRACVLERGSRTLTFPRKSFCDVSVSPFLLRLKLWTVARQLWQSAQRSTGPPWSKRVHLFCAYDKNHRLVGSEVKDSQRLQSCSVQTQVNFILVLV